MKHDEVQFDHGRHARIGLGEAVLCEGKTASQIEHIIATVQERGGRLLLTRLSPEAFSQLGETARRYLDYDETSRTGITGPLEHASGPAAVAIVSAGTSDANIVREAARTLAFHGVPADIIMDIGVAGLWRVLERHEQLDRYRALIVVAGMDGALFSVIGGLVGGAVIAVPTATGYGAANGGSTALHAALVSCAPGVVVVNIANGYGAACAALRVLRSSLRRQSDR